jgi:hypothetical protein
MNVISLKDHLNKRPPQWGAQVRIGPSEGGVVLAELDGFWGDDSLQVSDRCEAWADALYDLAMKLRETARLTEDSPSG